MREIRLWLPPASRAEVEAVITSVIDRWINDWFAAPGQYSVSATPPSALRKQSWLGGDDVMVGCEEGMAVRIGAAICAGQADIENRRDQAILAEVGQASLKDLATKFGAHDSVGPIGESAVPAWAKHCFIVTATNREWSLGLTLGDEAVTALRRTIAGHGTAPKLGKILPSLAEEYCHVALHLGQAKIDAPDLAALAPGDVIVFDQMSGAALPLMVEGHFAEGGRAKIEPGDTTLQIAIAASPSLLRKDTEFL